MDSLQKSVIQGLVLLLHVQRAGGEISVEELARKCGLSKAEVRRRVEILRWVRVDDGEYEFLDIFIEDDQVSLGPARGLDRCTTALTLEEYLALVFAVREAEKARLGIAWKDCQPMLRRLAGCLRPAEEVPIEVHADALPEDWMEVRDVAIPGSRILEIQYWTASRDASTRREVVPLRLQNDRGTWYLRAWCLRANAERSFRLDRVISHRDTGRVHAGPMKTVPGIPVPPEREARVRFDAEVASWARERIPDAVTLPDGSLEAVLPYQSEVLFAAWILSMSGHARVVDPPELRREIRDRLRSAFRRNGRRRRD